MQEWLSFGQQKSPNPIVVVWLDHDCSAQFGSSVFSYLGALEVIVHGYIMGNCI